MSALTKLAALRMQERELLRLSCAVCAHPLGAHSIWTNQCAGDLGGKVCRCAEWQDPDE